MAGGEGRARIETLTVLFTDLVDSTGLRVRSGEEAADQTRLRHDRLQRAAILGNSGTGAKHTGDGLMATFAGASDAINAAVAIQQAVDADNRQGGAEPLRVRIGISVGDVSVEQGDVFGLPVVEAQRLESAAGPGQILLASMVKALARGRGGHEFESVGRLELKGLDEPLDAERVVWKPLDAREPAAVRPPALVQHGGFAFAGRVRERAALDDAWNQARGGACRLVFLAGEPGIGKTRLASEFASDAAAQGGRVLAGRCDEMVSEPYQPFGEALRFQLTQPDGVLLLGDAAEELARIVPEISVMRPDLGSPLASTPDAERIRFFDGARSWLAHASSEAPLLLVLDDAHWADAGSLLLLRHIVATDPVPNLLALVTYRDTDLARTHPLASMLSDFHRRADAVRIALKGLDETDVAELVTLASGQPLEADARRLVTALSEETGGNPFFAGEVLRHLVESGAITHRDGRWGAGSLTEGDLPEGVREVVGRRLSALPEGSQQLLSAASVIGARFDLNLLLAVVNSDEDRVLDDLEPAIAAHLVSETGFGRFQFAHALIRSTLHQELSTTRRARLHRSVAQAILRMHEGDLDPVVADLAYHFGEAGAAASSDEALIYARRAADVALARLAPDEAIRWSRAALDLVEPDDLHARAELLGILALAESAAGLASVEQAQNDAARAALAAGDVELAADVIGFANRLVTAVNQEPMPERVAILETILGQVPRDEYSLRAMVMARLALAVTMSGDLEGGTALMDGVRRLMSFVDVAELPTLITVLFAANQSSRTRAQVVDEFALIRDALDEIKATGTLEQHLTAVLCLRLFALLLGDGTAVRKYAAEQDRLVAQYPHPFFRDSFVLNTMVLALVDGRIESGEEHLRQFAELSVRHGRPSEAALYATVGGIGIALERDGMGTVAELALTVAQGPSPAAGAAAVAASALVHAGRRADAAMLVDEHAARGFPDIIGDASWPIAVAFWADAAASLRHRDASRALYERVLPLGDLHLVTGGYYGGCATRHLARLAGVLGLPEATTWFETALAEHERMLSPPWIARAHLDWAEHLVDLGDTQAARAHAQQALGAIGDLDLKVSSARARALLTET